MVFRFDCKSVELKCRNCDVQLPADLSPRWDVLSPDIYVVRLWRCQCRSRKGSMPIDQNIPFQHPASAGHVKTTGSEWETLLRPAGDPEVPRTVETWCHRCKEDTKTVDRSSIYVDKDPRWTIGNHPMYVERKPTCKICADQGRVARFVFVDDKILSIIQTTLIRT